MATLNDLRLKIIENCEEEFVESDLEFVEKTFDCFRKYFNSVYEHVVGAEAQRLYLQADRIDIDTFQSRIMKLDSDRKLSHDLAVDACKKLNRQCDVYNIPHICPDTDNRAEIADYVGRLIYGIYQRGISKDRTIEEKIESRGIKYGDRLALDAAFEIAKQNGKIYDKDDEKMPHGEFDFAKEQSRNKEKRKEKKKEKEMEL